MNLVKKKEPVPKDLNLGYSMPEDGLEEYVMKDFIFTEGYKENFVPVVEAKRFPPSDSERYRFPVAMNQLLLLLKDLRDVRGKGAVYGFLTSGGIWRMLFYDVDATG